VSAAVQPRVSLVITVLNEAASIGGLLASIDAQTQHPDEVVIVDGGSTDGTPDLLNEWASHAENVRILMAPGASISRGRNLGIREATGEIVAVTDAGTVLDPVWLETLTHQLEAQQDIDVAAGFFVPDRSSFFDRVMGATVLPAAHEVDAENFLPSSRSIAFRRAAWERVGGYPEWLDYCEDLVFDLALKRSGARFAWVPEARVQFRTRPNLKSFFLQYFRYARGDGKADLWRLRHAVRYAVYILLALLTLRPSLIGVFLAGLGAAAYIRRPVQRYMAAEGEDAASLVRALGLIPVIRVTGDIAKMAGYPVGWAWRLRHGAELPT
jgi:glycosyltransferase involved in cell wall biosynthesis